MGTLDVTPEPPDILADDPAARWRPTPLGALRDGGIEAHFVRDHHGPPAPGPEPFSLRVDGAVRRPQRLDLAALHALPRAHHVVVLECAGHRRAEHVPLPEGLPWGVGAVGEARWGGAPLRCLLEAAQVEAGAIQVVLHGADGFARALPLDRALDGDVLLAFEVDGLPLPEVHGAPVRAVVPGWYATDSVKWLHHVEVVREPFAGYWEREEYRFVAPGEEGGPGRRMTALPVHALVTAHDAAELRGVAWSDGTPIARVDVCVDDGPWRTADLEPGPGRWSLTRWRLGWAPGPGQHSVAVRATDAAGRSQPDRPAPNLGGFANHAVHRVLLQIG